MEKGDPVWIVKWWNVEWSTLTESTVSYVDDDGSLRVRGIPYNPVTGVCEVGTDGARRSWIVPRGEGLPQGCVVHDKVVFIPRKKAPVNRDLRKGC